MWILLIVVLAALTYGAIYYGLIAPPHASTVIRISNGKVQFPQGNVKSEAREHITEILNEARVKKGYIAVTPNNRVFFSRHIPASIHQRLRNVLLNQWT